MDTLAPFLEEHCVLGAELKEPAAAIYGAYQRWADQNHEETLGKKAFGFRLAQHGFEARKGAKGQRWWHGLRLRVDNEVAHQVAYQESNPELSRERETRESSGNDEAIRHSRHLGVA